MAIARPDINKEAAMHVIIPIMIVSRVIEIVMVLNISKDDDEMIMLTTVKMRPIKEAIIPVITVAKYFPVINSLAFTGNVNKVSRVPFSFSTAVADVAIFVLVKTIDIIIYVNAM